MDLSEKIRSVKRVFDGHLLKLDVQTVTTPNGESASREIVRHAPSVALLMINDQQQMIVERQWRAPISGPIYEIPAGKVDERDGGDPRHAAIREMNEETRLQAGHLEKITAAYPSVGFTDEFMTIYMATDLQPVTKQLAQDADEKIELHYLNLSEALQMIKDGRIKDMKTVLAVFYWQAHQTMR